MLATIAALTTVLISGCATSSTPDTPATTGAADVKDRLRALVPPDVLADGRLTIVTDPTYAPMEFIQTREPRTQSVPVGADIEIGDAIAATFGLLPRYEFTPFSNVIPAVAIQEFELGISSLWADNRQAPMVNMITYFQAGTEVAVRASGNTITSIPRGLCGHSVAAEASAEYIDVLVRQSSRCVKRGEEPIKIVTAYSQARASKLLENSKVDALVGDSPTIEYTAARSNGTIITVGPSINVRPYGIAVSPRYADLTLAVQAAVQHLIDTGEYAAILARWNVSNGAIPRSEIRYGAPDSVG